MKTFLIDMVVAARALAELRLVEYRFDFSLLQGGLVHFWEMQK